MQLGEMQIGSADLGPPRRMGVFKSPASMVSWWTLLQPIEGNLPPRSTSQRRFCLVKPYLSRVAGTIQENRQAS